MHVSQSRPISQTPLWQDNPWDKQQQPTDGKNSSVSLHSVWSLYWEKQQSYLKAFQDFLCDLTKTWVLKIAINVKFEADWQVVTKIARESAKESVTNCQVCLWCFSCSQENWLVVFCYLDTKVLPGTRKKIISIWMDERMKVVIHTFIMVMKSESVTMDNR